MQDCIKDGKKIDPPYNTGNKDFKYNDEIVNKEDSWRHSKWLSFMDKRLKLAKELLPDHGVIFISIDDNELYQLKLLCDEIFGEENFVANLVWTNKEGGGGSDSNHFKVKHEYILVFAKKIKALNIAPMDIEDIDRYKKIDKYVKTRGHYQLVKLASASIQYSSSLDYPITMPDGTNVCPVDNTDKDKACWRWSKTKLKWGLENDFVEFKKDKNKNWQVYTKQYANCDKDGNIVKRQKTPSALIDKFSSTQGSKQLHEIFKTKVFNYPKPSSLINWILERVGSNVKVLDFFAGSGTTGHAVLELNKRDGGNRQFILCTNNEVGEEKEKEFKKIYNVKSDEEFNEYKNSEMWREWEEMYGISSSITYPRLQKVIYGYITPKGKEVDGIEGNLRYFKTDFISKQKPKDQLKKEIAQKASELLCIKEGVFESVEINNRYNIYKQGDKVLAIYHSFNDTDLEKLNTELDAMEGEKILYCFTFGSEILGDIREWTNVKVKPIPEKILDIYNEAVSK